LIDPKYTTKSLTVLTDPEKIMEVTMAKITTSLDLFTEDLKLAQSLNLNISRIIRHKFHEWLLQKVTYPQPPDE